MNKSPANDDWIPTNHPLPRKFADELAEAMAANTARMAAEKITRAKFEDEC